MESVADAGDDGGTGSKEIIRANALRGINGTWNGSNRSAEIQCLVRRVEGPTPFARLDHDRHGRQEPQLSCSAGEMRLYLREHPGVF